MRAHGTHGWLTAVGVATWAALLATGCMLSDSAGSLSDSVSSPFEWSSSLSGGAAGAYHHAIREQTLSFLESGGSLVGFQRELSVVAGRHGVLDWEAEPGSFLALGEGLRAAGVEGPRLAELIRLLGAGQPRRIQALRRGYDGWERAG